MVKRKKRHFCGECKRWYSDSSSFTTHIKKHKLPKGVLPEGSKTPRTTCEINYPFECNCGKSFKSKTKVINHTKKCERFKKLTSN